MPSLSITSAPLTLSSTTPLPTHSFGNLVDLDPARGAKTVNVNQYRPLAWISRA